MIGKVPPVPVTRTAVPLAAVLASETCTGVAEVPISVPDALRKLMNNPRTYHGLKPEEQEALDKLMREPQTYTGPTPPLGQTF